MDDREDFDSEAEPPTEPVSERVRIFGAQPASSAADRDVVETDVEDATSEMNTGAVPDLSGEDEESSALPGATPGNGPPEMQHWTDPPTGQVPAVLDRRGGAGDGGSGWSATGDTGPAWREHEHEWDDSGFDPSLLADDSTALGALGEAPVEERRPWEFDDLGASASGSATPGHRMSAEPVSTAPVSREPVAENGAAADDGDDWWDEDHTDRQDARAEGEQRGTPLGEATRSERVGTKSHLVEPAPVSTPAEESARRAGRDAAGIGAEATSRPAPDAASDRAAASAGASSGTLASISSSPLRLGRRSQPAGPFTPGPSGPRGGFGSGPRDDSGGRSIPVAIATGLGVALVAVLCFKAGSVATLVLAAIIVTLAAAECYAALRRTGRRPATFLGLVGTVAVMVAAYAKGVAALPLVLVLVVVAALLWYLVGADRGSAVEGVASTVFAFAWIGLLGSFSALMLAPSQYPQRHGVAFLLGAVVATVGVDVGALAAGSWFGRHPLAPRVSPHKTWEGLVGGAVLAVGLSAGVTGMVHPWTPGRAAVLGIVAAVVAPLGDLCESMVKRDLGLKDMGSMLPGHGGVLDRVDALLFVLPATYYLVRVLNLG